MKIVLMMLLLILAGPLNADTETEITAALDYFSEVWNEGDVQAIRGYYHPDFVLVSQNGIVALKERMEDIKSITEEDQDRGVLEVSQVTVKTLGEKHAMVHAFSVLTFKDGSAFKRWFTTVYEKTPFGWKAVLTQE
ncbi:MAG: nuclear transport factor 2 family protein [Xanthomonadales bacterium]|nr:nuclear transport factor 2 family protein [Gammaproteobacteria bacterium]MBT8054014.1 nuclear transport factor 2 family protein [Gammaproteobacteria bacterium]NND56976.1 nuclear transport factor 2 family protein [Xanthomonadales bacterium]NNK51934.1 nuclear transport factor 2 family protein [Xanthomonadales bacterium]